MVLCTEGSIQLPEGQALTSRQEWRWAAGVALLIVALASLPYLVGWIMTPDGYHFTGMLINPIDGNSYLAKMGQGAAGSWLFRLPYSSENHSPVLIFTYHLFLGHLAPGNSPITLVWVYHLTRVFWGFVLMLAVYGAACVLLENTVQRRLAFLLVGLASGLGWIVGSSPDLTVPEAITFPSLLVNAHFGLTALLILVLVTGLTLAPANWFWRVVILLAGVSLTGIQPYAVLTVGAAAGAWCLIRWFQQKSLPWSHVGRLAWFGLSSLPLLLYFLWMTRDNALIGEWMAQNVTPSPALGQWLAAYGLLAPLAAVGAWRAARRRRPGDWFLLTWLVMQVLLMLLPISLQRRLSTGLHLPLCFLATLGFEDLMRLAVRRRKGLAIGLLLLALPSNLLLILAGISAVANRNPYVVLSDAQWEAMAWLRENASAETIVLTDSELGTMVPAWGGGARVVYGHPFETVDAERKLAQVEAFFSAKMTADEQAGFLDRYQVKLIILQSDKHTLWSIPPNFTEVWRSGPVRIFQVDVL